MTVAVVLKKYEVTLADVRTQWASAGVKAAVKNLVAPERAAVGIVCYLNSAEKAVLAIRYGYFID